MYVIVPQKFQIKAGTVSQNCGIALNFRMILNNMQKLA